MVVVLVLMFAAGGGGGGGGGVQRQQWLLIDSWPCHEHAGTGHRYMGDDDDDDGRIINELIECSHGDNGPRTTTTPVTYTAPGKS